eukprot:m.42091 g.42091  ORF g.42091 m.42091 type:complete len:367 (-) comp9844_c0_seq1:191-1291(-)
MPIICKDYQWTENNEEVFVTVPLKGVKKEKVDLYSNEVYIKVNYSPYIFEADLCKEIDAVSSTAVVEKGAVRFSLKKKKFEAWGALLFKGDKDTIRERRAAGEEAERQRHKHEEEKQKEDSRERKKKAIQKQMDEEASRRRKMEETKDDARKEAADEINEIESHAPSAPLKKLVDKREPQLRKSGKIEITFSARPFANPARESHAAEEEEWLAKQRDAMKQVEEAKKMAKDAGVENDPLWLKDKGNDLFAAGDYQSAINAYSAAVSLDNKMAIAFSNRAACHLKLSDFQAAATDASKALSLLLPAVDANKKSRLRAHCRRAAALTALEDFEAAYSDIKMALTLDPDNETIQNDEKELLKKKQESKE